MNSPLTDSVDERRIQPIVMNNEPRNDAERDLLSYLEGVRDLRARHGKPPEFQYFGVEDYLLQHGSFFVPKPLPPTIRPMPLQQCFTNSLRVALRTKAYHYVEGYALGLIPIHHAWLIDKDGNVADPTWASGNTTLGTAYFGVEFDVSAVRLAHRVGCSVLEDYRRDFPVLQGDDVIHKDAWFRR